MPTILQQANFMSGEHDPLSSAPTAENAVVFFFLA